MVAGAERRRVVVGERRLGQLGEAEVEDLGRVVLGDHHVRGLEVAVDDAGGVGAGEGVGDLLGVAQAAAEGQRPLAHALLEGLPGDELHDDEVLPVGVTRRRGSATMPGCCSAEAAFASSMKRLPSLRVGDRLGGQGLEGDEAAEQGVAGLVDDAHAALPQLLDDAVAVDRLADHEQLYSGGSLPIRTLPVISSRDEDEPGRRPTASENAAHGGDHMMPGVAVRWKTATGAPARPLRRRGRGPGPRRSGSRRASRRRRCRLPSGDHRGPERRLARFRDRDPLPPPARRGSADREDLEATVLPSGRPQRHGQPPVVPGEVRVHRRALRELQQGRLRPVLQGSVGRGQRRPASGPARSASRRRTRGRLQSRQTSRPAESPGPADEGRRRACRPPVLPRSGVEPSPLTLRVGRREPPDRTPERRPSPRRSRGPARGPPSAAAHGRPPRTPSRPAERASRAKTGSDFGAAS